MSRGRGGGKTRALEVSLAIISKREGLDRVLSEEGGGDIGLRRPAVRAELNLVKDELKEESMAVEEGNLGFGEEGKCEEGDMDGDSGGGVWVEMVVGVWREGRRLGSRWWDEEIVVVAAICMIERKMTKEGKIGMSVVVWRCSLRKEGNSVMAVDTGQRGLDW